MNRVFEKICGALIVCTLCLSVPAFASGGTTSGGTSGGGGSTSTSTSTSTSGGGKTTTTTATPIYSTSALVGAYYSTGPTGTITFGYTLDNTFKSIDIVVNNLTYADGSVLPVLVYMTRPDPTTYYGTSTTVVAGQIIAIGGQAQMHVSTANGDVVPDFPIPSAGTTTVYIESPFNSFLLSGSLSSTSTGGGANAKHSTTAG